MIIEAILLGMQSEKSSDADVMVENSAIQTFCHWQDVRDFAVVQQKFNHGTVQHIPLHFSA